MKIEEIAKVCHETNRAYCEILGDTSQVKWELAPKWQQESAINGVKYKLENPLSSPREIHQNWLDQKLREGWKYGAIKDVIEKTHPCMLPYDELPYQQRVKDILFSAICITLGEKC